MYRSWGNEPAKWFAALANFRALPEWLDDDVIYGACSLRSCLDIVASSSNEAAFGRYKC